jgi:large subunit ribosomal protein L17
MRHGRAVIKLSRNKSHREAMLSNMSASILEHIQVRTTLAKARAVKRWTDYLVSLGKKGDLHSRRLAFSVLKNRKLVKKLFDEIAPKLTARQGGYTKVLKLGYRQGDGAKMAVVQLLVEKPKIEKKKKGEKDEKEKSRKEEKNQENKADQENKKSKEEQRKTRENH